VPLREAAGILILGGQRGVRLRQVTFSPRRSLIFGLCCLLSLPALALPGFAEVKAGYTSSQANLLARDGRPLHALRIDHSSLRWSWTPLSEISPALIRALVASEDQRFFQHAGVDWLAAGKAAWSNVRGQRTRGASTLTMQLAGLIDEDARRRGRRSLFEKISQTASALRIESTWNKAQIIEAYLNLVSFRGELQGVGAMSRQLFGKWPHGLDDHESALAAALLRAPNAASALVAKRACALLAEMQRPTDCAALEGLAFRALSGGMRDSGGERNASRQLAPHLARKLLAQPGQQLRSSLDAELQGFAFEALRRHLAALRQQNVEDGAVLVIDNAKCQRRDTRLGRFERRPVRGRRSRWRHGLAPGRIDAEALALRAGLRAPAADAGFADRRRAADACYR